MRNWQKKLTYILVISVIIGTYLKLNSSNSVKPSPEISGSSLETPKKIATRSLKESVVIEKARDCLVQKGVEDLPSVEQMEKLPPAWENIHFKKDGQIYRLREFNDDGPNGDIRKLILYKEDADEFAHIEKIWESGNFEEIRRGLLDNSEQIHKELAIILNMQQKTVFMEFLNSDLNRLEVNNISILAECSK
jgi:hypothetical protein